jgi:hypothetical protein
MDITELMGKTLTAAEGQVGGNQIVFTTAEGSKYKMYHSQNCCESVTVEDICGSLQELVGSPIIQAEESESAEWPEGVPKSEYEESYTWSFYRLATAKGQVVIRWFGSSNGYYSESVDFEKL